MLDQLFERRLLMVTGKGGTGKTTVTATLGLAAAARGKRTLLVEVGGARGLARLLDLPPLDYRKRRVAEGLHLLSIDAHAALEDYVVLQLKMRALYRLVFRNRVVGPFMDAVPGLPDLIQLGKIWDLAQEREGDGPAWDLLILDAPATGHGLTMLSAPQRMMDVTSSGPFHANAKRVRDLVSDPEQAAVVLTTLPEQLPVNETLQLLGGLGQARAQVACCVLNQLQRPPFLPLESWPPARQALEQLQHPAWREALTLTDRWVAQARTQQQARQRLERELEVPVLGLPYRLRRRLGLSDLRALAAAIDDGDAQQPPPQEQP